MSETEQANCLRAKAIIDKVGGVGVVRTITGRSRTRVYSWTYPKDRHGTGGLIPSECQQALLAFARENCLPLRPSDFFPPEREDAA